jgi:hypothetical protein
MSPVLSHPHNGSWSVDWGPHADAAGFITQLTGFDMNDETLLTDAEQEIVSLLGRAYVLLRDQVIAHGVTREDDCAEMRAHIHAVQNAVKAQAAARAYPSEFRLLGSSVESSQP